MMTKHNVTSHKGLLKPGQGLRENFIGYVCKIKLFFANFYNTISKRKLCCQDFKFSKVGQQLRMGKLASEKDFLEAWSFLISKSFFLFLGYLNI